MVYIDVGYLPDTAIKRRNSTCTCRIPAIHEPLEERYPVYPPFTDIGRGLSGGTRSQIWEKTTELYRNRLTELVTEATKRVNVDVIKSHVKFAGESDQSIGILMTSFTTVSRITREKLLGNNKVLLNFTFLSRFQTMRGESIKLIVPVLLDYETGNYSIMNPGFKVGD